MQTHYLYPLLILLFFSCGYSQNKVSMETESDSVSYSIGVTIGQNIVREGFSPLNSTIIAQAIEDVMNKENLKIPATQTGVIINNFITKSKSNMAETTKKESEAFLEQNKTKEGVIVLPSGLQYVVINEGTGEKPTLTDKVKTHYHGTLPNGEMFDSSVERGEPVVFAVNGVIKGWTEALQLMSVNSKWKLFIPSELAYGERGTPGGPINPHQALIFEIELLEIIKEETK